MLRLTFHDTYVASLFSLFSFLLSLFSSLFLSSSLLLLSSLSSLLLSSLFSLLSSRGHFHTVVHHCLTVVIGRSDTPSHTENHLWFAVCAVLVSGRPCVGVQPYSIPFGVTPVLPSLSWDLRHTHQPSSLSQALDAEPLRASLVPDRLLHAETLSNL